MDKNDPLYLEAFQQYKTLYHYCKQGARRRCDQALNGRQIALLRYLMEQGSGAPGELARYLLINRSSTSEMLQVLEHKGLLERSRVREDNRQVRIVLTEKGRIVAEEAQADGLPLLREKMALLDDRDLRELARILNRLNTLLEIQND